VAVYCEQIVFVTSGKPYCNERSSYLSTGCFKNVGIFGVIGVIVLIFFSIKARCKDLNYQFNGRVDSVFYGEKATATVWVKKEKYYLDANNWDFDHNRIQKGDSLIKEKNSMVIRLIRPNGSVIVEGEN
jgi:hypothetical protein